MGLFAGVIAQKVMMAMGTFSNLNTFLSLRTLFLSSATHDCGDRAFGSDDYSCVDYSGGSYKLSGKTLSFRGNLNYADCGCNAAIYLVAMPRSGQRSDCDDFYCDANSGLQPQ